MEEFSTAKYVQLSNSIFVPNKWSVKGLEKFLLQLTKLVIVDVSSDKVIVLQVQDIPTMLVRREGKNGIQFIFKRISGR